MDLNHEQLAAARDREDWGVLGAQVPPLIGFLVGRMKQRGQLSPEIGDDLAQEAMLAGLEAVHSWQPLEGTFATWIISNARGVILNHLRQEIGGMVGGRDARVGMQTIHGEPYCEARWADLSPDEYVDRGYESRLAYADAPETLDNPLEEVCQAEREAYVVQLLRQLRNPQDQDMLRHLYGLGCEPMTQEEYALFSFVPYRTVKRRTAKLLKYLARSGRNPL
jgi:RNA polymerase sigma factor (sigma-70 family)